MPPFIAGLPLQPDGFVTGPLPTTTTYNRRSSSACSFRLSLRERHGPTGPGEAESFLDLLTHEVVRPSPGRFASDLSRRERCNQAINNHRLGVTAWTPVKF